MLQAYSHMKFSSDGSNDLEPRSLAGTYRGSDLKAAVEQGDLEAIKNQLDSSTGINPFIALDPYIGYGDTLWSVLHVAADHGKLDIVDYILPKLINKNPRSKMVRRRGKFLSGRTPLHLAAMEGHLKIVEYLMECLIDKNPGSEYDYTPLHLAANWGHLSVVKKIVQQVEDKNPRAGRSHWHGATPVHRAAANGHLEIIKFYETVIDETSPLDLLGQTPMHYAAQTGHLDVIKYYLDRLTDKNPGRKSYDQWNGRTVLQDAAQYGHLDVIQLIESYLPEKNPKDKNGYTPFHIAAVNGYLVIVKYYVESLPIWQRNLPSGNYFDRKTPLHWAAENGHLDIVKYLAGVVSDPKVLTMDGKTAFGLAKENGYDNIAKFLEQYN